MAKRIVFRPVEGESAHLFIENIVEFDWVAGMSKSQNQKWIRNLHEAARRQLQIQKILEISSKSESQEGVQFSAFNLRRMYLNRITSVECLYQGSKVFENGGPYLDMYEGTSIDAKRDSRIKESGRLQHFEFESKKWELSESPNFFDYLYLKALSDNSKSEFLLEFEAFTDFAYSQTTISKKDGKSFNCQARSAAIFVSLVRSGKLIDFLSSPQDFQHLKSAPAVHLSSQLNLFDA